MLDLSDIPVIDHHVHPWPEASRHQTVDELAGKVAFSDEVVTSVRQSFLPAGELEPSLRLFRETSLGVRYLFRELASFLQVDEDWAAVSAERNAAAAADYRAWTARLFGDAAITGLLIDEGGAQPRITLDDLGRYVPAALHRVARADNFVRDLLRD